MRMPQHPINILLVEFKKLFKQKYGPFFNKAQFRSRKEAVSKLSQAIEAQDSYLVEQYPCEEGDDEP